MKCLYDIKNIDNFLLFSSQLRIMNWKIEKQLLKDRVLKYKNNPEFKSLQERFLLKELSIWPLKGEEIITWFDTVSLLERILNKLKNLINPGYDVGIIMEYLIPNGNFMRCDYLLVFDRVVFILEFGMFNQDERRGEERYTKKLLESIAYRQLLDNQIPKEIKIINYVLIYRPEYDDDSKKYIDENISYNKNEVSKLITYLSKIINDEIKFNAYEHLKSFL